MDKSVLIMMAAYNGEKYIREQIESIISQTYKNWKLIIQDDGSTDDTISVVQEYCRKDNRISIINNQLCTHGAFINFHILINYCKKLEPYDFYMFCDQDDIWHEDKVEKLVESCDKLGMYPAFCYADMSTIDENGNVGYPSLDKKWKLEKKNRTSFFFSHKVFGCNMIINRKLFEIVPEVDTSKPHIEILSHDNYYAKFAAVFGRFCFVPEVLMKYRRHEGNATTEQKYDVTIKRILDRIINIDTLAEKHARTYNQSLMAVEKIKEMNLSNKQKSFVCSVEYAIKKGGIRSLMFCKKHHVIWGKFVENVSRRIVLFSAIYRKYLIKN